MVGRRDFMRGAALGALAFTIGGTQMLLTPREARARAVPRSCSARRADSRG